MANIGFWSYQPRLSPLHCIDSRVKLLLLTLHNYALLQLHGAGLCVVAVGILLLFWVSHIGWTALLSSFKMGVYLALFVLLLQVFSVPRDPSDVLWQVSFFWLSYSQLTYIFRLFLLLLSGQWLISTSTLAQISQAVDSFLQYIPLLRRVPLGWLLRLSWGFFPNLYHNALQIQAAQKSRLLVPQNNFRRYLRYFSQAFMTKAIKKTYYITLAMQSRSFMGKPQPSNAPLQFCDMVAVLVFVVWHIAARYSPQMLAVLLLQKQ